MRVSSILTLGLVTTSVIGAKAPKIKKNPADVIAIADFPAGGPEKIKGNVVFTAKQGKTVNVHVDVTGLPRQGGPFVYHIHEFPVHDDGDCEKAGLHFNPYKAPADCDAQKSDDYCQVGDLSGKHGWINTTCFETSYDDPFLSLNSNSKSSIIGRSLVFHYADLNKFACANIELATDSRVKDLNTEYTANGNPDLNELQQFVNDGYSFDAHEAEILEVDDDNDDDTTSNDLQTRDFNMTQTMPYDNVSNVTNVSSNKYSSDCENKGYSFATYSFPLGLAAIVGIFI